MPDLDNLDYESTLGPMNGGEPTAVTTTEPAPQKPAEPTTTSTPVEHQDDELELDAQGQPVLDEHGQPKKKMGGFQRRIEKLSRKLQEKDQELEFLRRYALPQAPGGPASQPTTTQVQPQPAAEPTRDQFESNEEYIQALVDHRVQLATQGIVQTLEEKNRQTATQRTEQEVQTQFQQRLQQAPAKYKDWMDVMEDTTAPSTPVMDNIIRRSEFGIDLMYYLAKNEAEATRIVQLSDPTAQTMAMGALEDRFRQASKTTQKPTPQPSAAPPPINPVTTATQASAKPVSEMDGDEYLAHMRSNKKKR